MRPLSWYLRRAATAAATTALVTGTVAGTVTGTAPAALAQPTAPTTAATTAATTQPATQPATAAEHCQAERADVAAAKVRVRKAKRATVHRSAKLRRARANLSRQRVQAARWCSRAKSEAAATATAEQRAADYGTMTADPGLAGLPVSIQTPLDAMLQSGLAQVEALTAQIPSADSAGLAHIVTNLDALDPSALQAALGGLVAQLGSAGGDPAATAALVDSLLGDLPAGTVVPGTGNLGALDAVLHDVVAGLEGFDPAGSAGQLQALSAKVEQASTLLGGSSADLGTLFSALGALNGGTVPTDPAAFTALLGALLGGGGSLPFALPGDLAGLASLTSALDSLSSLLGGAALPTPADLLGPLYDLILLLGV